MTEFTGDHLARGRRFAVATARFNEVVTGKLLRGRARLPAQRTASTTDDVDVAWLPGAFELPLVARRLAASGTYDAVICLGAVIRGETPHFDHVAGQAATGIREAAEADRGPGDLRRPHDGYVRAGHGPRRGQAREQGLGRRDGGDGDGFACWTSCRRSDDRDRRQAMGQGRHLRAEPAELGPGDHGGAGSGDQRPLPPDARRDVGGAGPGSHRADRQPDGRGQRRGRSSWSRPRRTHRLANAGTARGRVLEIAYGYTTEDDTLRLQDDYGRSARAGLVRRRGRMPRPLSAVRARATLRAASGTRRTELAEQGTVKWFSNEKGYGFIARRGGRRRLRPLLRDRRRGLQVPHGGPGGGVRRRRWPQGQAGRQRQARLDVRSAVGPAASVDTVPTCTYTARAAVSTVLSPRHRRAPVPSYR